MALDGEAAAYIMYTSGSSGEPKGVVVPHRAIGRLVFNNGYAEFEAGDRVALRRIRRSMRRRWRCGRPCCAAAAWW